MTISVCFTRLLRCFSSDFSIFLKSYQTLSQKTASPHRSSREVKPFFYYGDEKKMIPPTSKIKPFANEPYTLNHRYSNVLLLNLTTFAKDDADFLSLETLILNVINI
jgi:hypothetical protein